MDHELITKINEEVQEDDTLWHLGDFMFGRSDKQPRERLEYYRNSILCKNIILILGNHDKEILEDPWMRSQFTAVMPYFIGFIEGTSYVLTHKPLEDCKPDIAKPVDSWIALHPNTLCLFGHTHNNSHVTKFNMCVENHNYKPVKLG